MNHVTEAVGTTHVLKQQGYVPDTCTLTPDQAFFIFMGEVMRGVDPCAGCNANREVCKGRPKSPR